MMRFFLLLIIGAVGFGIFTEGRKWWQSRQQSEMLIQAVASGQATFASTGIPSSCKGKTYCITAFIAPWCPACKTTEPVFQALQKYLPAHRADVGFGIVIGAAKSEQNKAKQSELVPIESYTDDSGSLMDLRQIKSFPTWIITDATGKEITRKSGGFQHPGDSQMDQVVAYLLER